MTTVKMRIEANMAALAASLNERKIVAETADMVEETTSVACTSKCCGMSSSRLCLWKWEKYLFNKVCIS